MTIMAILKSFIYLVASSLLAPVLVLLAGLTVWVVVYAGSFTGRWLERRRWSQESDALALLRQNSFGALTGPVQNFINTLESRVADEQLDIVVVDLLRESEQRLWKSLDSLKMLIRIGPGLGLIGTLIPMGTGLAALGQGDLSLLSGNLVIAFTTTVVGMSLGMVAYFFFTIQRRWVEEDVKNMELAAEIILAVSKP